jgi:hypothetical protein
MTKRIFNLLIISVLALNLMGAWAFAASFDCGMECCQVSDTARAGIPTLESPSCCQTSGVTCGYQAGHYEELFDEVLCCHSGVQKVSGEEIRAVHALLMSPSPAPTARLAESSIVKTPSTPLYINNLALIC